MNALQLPHLLYPTNVVRITKLSEIWSHTIGENVFAIKDEMVKKTNNYFMKQPEFSYLSAIRITIYLCISDILTTDHRPSFPSDSFGLLHVTRHDGL